MFYRIKFILKELFIEPVVMFWKQILISLVLAGVFTLTVKPNIYLFFTVMGLCFLGSLMITMANHNYERQKEKFLDELKRKQ